MNQSVTDLAHLATKKRKKKSREREQESEKKVFENLQDCNAEETLALGEVSEEILM